MGKGRRNEIEYRNFSRINTSTGVRDPSVIKSFWLSYNVRQAPNLSKSHSEKTQKRKLLGHNLREKYISQI